MKKYNQLKEDIDSLYLREWEKADDQWKREWLELYSEVYDIELNEDAGVLSLGVPALAAKTSPIWVPALKAAVATGGAYLASKGIGKMWDKHQQKKAQEKWLKGNLQSGETYSSGSQEKGINKSYKPPGNKNNKNNGNGKLKKAVTAGVVGTGVVSGVNTLSGNKDKSTETNYTNQLKKKNNNGSSSSPSNRNTTTSKLKFEL